MPTLKKLLGTFLFVTLCFTSFSQFREIFSDGDDLNAVKKVDFYSPSEGYVAFQKYIGYTTDSGHTYTRRYITYTNTDFNNYFPNYAYGFQISGIKAFGRETLIVYGDYAAIPSILYSNNGGNSFKLVFHSPSTQFRFYNTITDMKFPSGGNVGYAVDADRILKTVDKGLTWAPVFAKSESYFDYLEAVDDNNVIALGSSYLHNTIWKTRNGGTTWQQLAKPTTEQMLHAYFLTPEIGWLSARTPGGEGYIYQTLNGGSSWILKNNVEATSYMATKMRFVNDSTGYASGGYILYKTTNAGKVWEPLPSTTPPNRQNTGTNDLFILNSMQFWLGGDKGTVQISTNGGGIPIPKAFFLIDTTNLSSTGTVTLTNYSRPGYQYQWYLNNRLISTGYNTSYLHDRSRTEDSVTLIVSNGFLKDTIKRYQKFFPPTEVTSFTPASGKTGTAITIKGSGFLRAVAVTLGDSSATFEVQSDNTIRAIVGTGASGNVKVFSETDNGSLPGFVYIPPPVISSFSPAAAVAGTTITITGVNFNQVTAVNFGGSPAVSYSVISSTSIQAVVGAGSSGSISVSAIGGIAVRPGFLTIPKISSFTPTAGTFGTYMTITGTGFGDVVKVTIGGLPVSSFVINSPTSITAIVSTGTSGAVQVTSPGGSSALGSFVYNEPPAITLVSPLSGAIGSSVVISGSNFNIVATENIVYFGGVKAEVISASSSTLTVKVPAGAGYAPLSVTSKNLTAYSTKPFTVTFDNAGSITENSFKDSLQLPVSSSLYQILRSAVADIDGDGKPEVILLKITSPTREQSVAIYPNTSTGDKTSFGPALEYFIEDPKDLVVVDMDGDGKLDIVVSNGNNNGLSILRNNSASGNFDFTNLFMFQPVTGGSLLGVTDLDSDGKPDLIFANWFQGKTITYRNISNPGAIAFGSGVLFPGNPGGTYLLRDMDNDGKVDVIDANNFFKNTSIRGTISFEGPKKFSVTDNSHINVGDLDGDGSLDIVVAVSTGSQIGIYRNQGKAIFTVDGPVLIDALVAPFGISLHDLDGDSKPDIINTFATGRIATIKNVSTPGNILFGSPVKYNFLQTTINDFVSASDLNGDGKPEIIVSAKVLINSTKAEPFIQSFTPTMAVSGTRINITGRNFINISSVQFGGVNATSFTVNSATSITATLGEAVSGTVAVTNDKGVGVKAGFIFGFAPVITNVFPASATEGSDITISGSGFSALSDNNMVFFGSIKAQVISATATSLVVKAPKTGTYTSISVTSNNRTAYSTSLFLTTFAYQPNSVFTAQSFSDSTQLRDIYGSGSTIDVDGDGKLDLITYDYQKTMRILRNVSTPTSTRFIPFYNMEIGMNPNHTGFGDLDGDGKMDLIVTYFESRFISIFLNKSTVGTPAFAPRVDLSTGYQFVEYGPEIKDLDGDGKPEIIISGYAARGVSIHPNLSSANNLKFGERIDLGMDSYSTGVKVEDINGDNLPEIIAISSGDNAVSIFPNRSLPGMISFDFRKKYLSNEWPQSIAVGDLNGDGKKDLAVSNVRSNVVTLYRNASTLNDINFIRTELTVGIKPETLWINDMDGDGKPDMGVQVQESDEIYNDRRFLVLYKNTSAGESLSWAEPINYSIGSATRRSTTADMDRDGKPDIVIFSSSEPKTGQVSILILKNRAGTSSIVKLCAGTNTIIKSSKPGTTYQWQQNSGSGFTNLVADANIQGTTTDSLRLFNVLLNRNGYLYRCIVGGDTSLLTTLQVDPVPIANAGADTIVCAIGNGTRIGSPAVAGNTYLWTPEFGLSSPLIAEPIAKPSGNLEYTLTVTNANGCVSKDVVSTTIRRLNSPDIFVNGSTEFCEGRNVTLLSSLAANNQWFKNGVKIIGATQQTFIATESGTYYANITDAQGCSSLQSNTREIIVSGQPTVPVISASGSTTFCSGLNVSLTAKDPGNYQWFKDDVLITGATTEKYIASASGIYTAKKIHLSCASSSSNAIQVNAITSNELPLISPLGSVKICEKDSLVLTSSSATGNQWYLDGVAINGAVRSTFTARQSGKYTVRVSVNGCVTNFSTPTSLTIIKTPATPEVNYGDAFLASNASTGNQWYLNGNAIAGANAQFYTPLVNGGHSVRVIADGCQSATSNVVNYELRQIAIGPNPMLDKLVIRYPVAMGTFDVMLSDINGHVMVHTSTSLGYIEINTAGFLPGQYILQLKNKNTNESRQMILLKL